MTNEGAQLTSSSTDPEKKACVLNEPKALNSSDLETDEFWSFIDESQFSDFEAFTQTGPKCPQSPGEEYVKCQESCSSAQEYADVSITALPGNPVELTDVTLDLESLHGVINSANSQEDSIDPKMLQLDTLHYEPVWGPIDPNYQRVLVEFAGLNQDNVSLFNPLQEFHDLPQPSPTPSQPSPAPPRHTVADSRPLSAKEPNRTYWEPPTHWTEEAANERASEVLRDPNLSEQFLPPEMALIFMPIKPDFAQTDVTSRRYPDHRLRNIPWLPNPFSPNMPAWKISLFQTFGAHVQDMADRVSPNLEWNVGRRSLSNRLLKKSLDYRYKHGGFGQDFRFFKSDKPSKIATQVIKGGEYNRTELTPEQLLFCVTWDIDLENGVMRQKPPGQAVWQLPPPMEIGEGLAIMLNKLSVPIPKLSDIRIPSSNVTPSLDEGERASAEA